MIASLGYLSVMRSSYVFGCDIVAAQAGGQRIEVYRASSMVEVVKCDD